MVTEYTDPTLVENYLKRELTGDERALLTVMIPAVRRWIDDTLGTTFVETTTPTSRYFDGGTGLLDVPGFKSISAIDLVDSYQTVNSTYDTNLYQAEPVNETVKKEIRLRYGRFPRGVGNVKVTAIFTEFDGGVPDDIALLATRLAGNMLTTDPSNRGVESEAIEGHSVKYNFSDAAQKDAVCDGILSLRRPLLLE